MNPSQQCKAIELSQTTDLSCAEIAKCIGTRTIHVKQFLDVNTIAERHEQERREAYEKARKERIRAENKQRMFERLKAAEKPSNPVFETQSGIVAFRHKSAYSKGEGPRKNNISLPALSFLEGE